MYVSCDIYLQSALWKSCQLKPEHLPRPDVMLHRPTKHEHGVADYSSGVEQASGGHLALGIMADQGPGLRVQVKGVEVVGQDVVGRAPEHVQLPVEGHHRVAVAAIGR